VCVGGGDFFCILAFLKKNREMNPPETYFHVLALSSHSSQVGATNEGVAPCALARLTSTWTSGCHVNPTGSTTPFGIQNELRHFDWRDSSMSRATTPFGVTHFGSKSAKSVFLIIYRFSITKNKYLTCSKIYTDFYTCRIEPGEQFFLLTQVQILHRLKTKIL
jgi:hypothetical protein